MAALSSHLFTGAHSEPNPDAAPAAAHTHGLEHSRSGNTASESLGYVTEAQSMFSTHSTTSFSNDGRVFRKPMFPEPAPKFQAPTRNDFRAFVENASPKDNRRSEVFLSEPDPYANEMSHAFPPRRSTKASTDGFMAVEGGSRTSSPLPRGQRMIRKHEHAMNASSPPFAESSRMLDTSHTSSTGNPSDHLPPEMVVFLHGLFDSAGGAEKEFVERHALRDVLQRHLDGDNGIDQDSALLLLLRFDTTGGALVSFEDLCRVFSSMAGTAEPAPLSIDIDATHASMIASMQDELDRSRAAYDELQAAMVRKQEEQINLTRRMEEEGAEQIHKLQSDIDRLIEDNRKLRGDLRELNNKVGSLEETTAEDAPSEEKGQRARRDTTTASDLRLMRQTNTELVAKVRELEIEVMRKRSEREEALATAAQYAATIAGLQTTVAEQAEVDRKCALLEHENTRLKVELEDLAMAQRDEESAEKVSRRSLIMLEDDLRAQLRITTQAKIAAEADAKRAREAESAATASLTMLQQASEQYQSELTALLTRMQQYKDERDQMEAQLQATSAAATDMMGECEVLAKAVKNAENRILELEGENAMLRNQTSTRGVTEADQLLARIHSMETDLRAIRENNQSLQLQAASSLRTYATDVGVYQQHITAADKAHAALQTETAQLRQSQQQLQEQLQQRDQRITALNADLTNASEAHKATEHALKLMREQLQNVLASRGTASTERETAVRRELERVQQQLTAAERATAELNMLRATEQADAELALHDAQERLAAAAADRARTVALEQRVAEKMMLLQQHDAEYDAARKGWRQAEQQLHSQIAQLNEQYAHLQDSAAQDIASRDQMIADLHNQLQELQLDNAQLAAKASHTDLLARALKDLLTSLQGQPLPPRAVESVRAAEDTLHRCGLLDIAAYWAPPREPVVADGEVLFDQQPVRAVPVIQRPDRSEPAPPHFATASTASSPSVPRRSYSPQPPRTPRAYVEPMHTPSPPETPQANKVLCQILTDSIPGLRVENIRTGEWLDDHDERASSTRREERYSSSSRQPNDRDRHERPRTTSSRRVEHMRDPGYETSEEARRRRRAFEAHTFPVTVLDSGDAARLGIFGQAWLRLKYDELALLDPETFRVHCAWPLTYVQHFGKNRGVFTFTAGELAGPLSGVFYLAGERTAEIFALMSGFSTMKDDAYSTRDYIPRNSNRELSHDRDRDRDRERERGVHTESSRHSRSYQERFDDHGACYPGRRRGSQVV